MRRQRSLLPLVLICASSSVLLLTATTNADNLTFYMYHNCPDNTTYTSGSAFQANLDAILSSLPAAAAASSSGFAEKITGAAAPDQVYGLAQCRGDISAERCRACLVNSAHEVASRCPSQKSALLIYEGCLLRYSNASFFGEADTEDPLYMCDLDNATQPQFASSRDGLMRSLAEKAYGSPRLFAASSVNLADYEKIYGMVQCTRDLEPDDCEGCLANAVSKIQTYKDCSGRQGGRLFNWSCYIRFAVKPFYNAQAAETAMSTGPGSSRRTVRNTALLVSVPVALTLLLLLLLLLAVCICKNRTTNKRYGGDEEMRGSETLQYDLGTLRAATDNFSEENMLGKGGFGPVYKGTMQNGQEIAVKRLSTISQQGLVEMKNEIVLVAKLQHKNLVRLLGFCIDEEEKLLVYEFLSNKSLNKILFDPKTQQQLSWGQRYKIIEGISRGLLYLHEDSRLTIIHRDLKPGNILLDADMNPKISDFGLAKLFKMESSAENTRHIAGTYLRDAADTWHQSTPIAASSLPSQTFSATASLSWRSSPAGELLKIC
ncbi:cysteine-rich receptor-like protein kinase 25 isoform X2 [Miscanthus floridulus]|uniref:cysteine-rich receptor-like protein kinase 25 isoform X2 n=1 Tax=Miscanthus floridulus TaxID=154761 RepID=UPI0034594D6F